MNITSTIRILFNKSNANRIYELGRAISTASADEEPYFTLKTSSRSSNPDTLLIKRQGEVTEEMVQELYEECNDALIRLNDYDPIQIVSLVVEKTTVEIKKYNF